MPMEGLLVMITKHSPVIHTPRVSKRFRITDPRTDEDVLGGAVSEDNAYIAAYGAPVNKGDPHPRDLEIGASVLRRYSLSGTTGTYRIVRIDDATTPEI